MQEENIKEDKKITKEFKPTSLSVDNKTSMMILSLIIVIFGLISYNSMPRESFPEIVIPQIYIGTFYPGNSPVDMENLVSRPIEKKLKAINGVKKVTSTSIQDYSTIIVEFNPDVKIAKALQDVKDAVDKAKSDLPNDLPQDPNIFEINFSDIPILSVNLSGNYNLEQLKEYAEYLKDEIEKLSEISRADVRGALKREIQINADVYQMEALNITFGDIESAIRGENITMSGGNILTDGNRRSIRVIAEFKNMEEIENIIVKDDGGNIVYLKDIAEVKDSFEERSSFARSRLQPVVSLDVVKRSGENLVDATDKIKAIVEKAKATRFPKDLQVSYTNDQSRFVRSMVADLENSIIFGMLLVIGILLFFMGFRSALMVGIAIPLSMFISFIFLSFYGVTLNTMVLFSLILALGMLVDNGIVVVENIYRLVGEIAVPIISSTATTVAAFLPLVFWEGILGQFMFYLPVTVMIVLTASLFVALFVNPAISMFFTRYGSSLSVKAKRNNLIVAGSLVVLSLPMYLSGAYSWANLFMVIGLFIPFNIYLLTPSADWFQRVGLTWLESFYRRTVIYALKRSYWFFFGTVALMIFSFYLVGAANLKILFFPENEPNYINIFIQKPIGTDIEVTNELTKKVEKKILEIIKPYDYMVEAVIAQVGEGTSDPNEGPSQGSSPNKARLTVNFTDFDQRKGVSTNAIMEEIREAVKQFAGAQITVSKENNGPPVGPPINIEISGDDYEKLIDLTERVKKHIENANIAGIEQLKYDLETGKPDLIVHIDRDKVRRFGLSSASVAMELRTALFGKEISKFKDGEDDYPIQLRLKEEQRYALDALVNKAITFRTNNGKLKQVPISSVADVEFASSFGAVKRKDLNRVITLYSNVKDGYNPTEIVNQIKATMQDFNANEGFDIRFTGEQEEQDKSAAFLGNALLLAIFMVFLIIVTQFNSITAPLIIMSSVLFSTIGVFLGLVIFQMDFVIIMTGIGIISLAGVVVNNAIVLIDYTNLLIARFRLDNNMTESEKISRHDLINCIAEAGQKRLRPVLLTAITTVLGLIPLAIGMNINFFTLFAEFDAKIYFGGPNAAFWGPMAWTVIFGLSFATFLTLVIVPVMYLLAESLKFRR
ncbi:MAG: efflux RND transporter permease subunit [Cytophagales bacterium]|nr:MAG: efflux RND transporter permease subunit [Cytophagales bacterium]